MISTRIERSDRGFSLVEMLVAVALFALIGLAGVTLIETILNAQHRTEDRLARLGQLQRGLYLVGLDLQEASPLSLTLTDGTLTFTRRDSEGHQISIGYATTNGILLRTIDAIRRQPILTEVTEIGWRFHVEGMGWLETPREENRKSPDGIELDIATKTEGRLSRVVDLQSLP